MDGTGHAALPLRDRKKAMTREAILTAAGRLFEERGFDGVTVAEIADAANVSVKTLFVYFRSKEVLAFADTSLIETVLAALQRRAPATARAEAVVEALIEAADRDGGSGVEGFHRTVGNSPALRSGLLRLWSGYEDRIAEALAREAGGPTPATRLEAMQLVALIRLTTSPELRSTVADLAPERAREVIAAELREAARRIGSAR
ncbi:MAG TPA: helix-turn-helix domain-containing protein [Candidatus Dormibacteraeota bacterium]|nr:helix-turn-helix domain-containing protein [Candidatus Dormibacteraeota bacterium]